MPHLLKRPTTRLALGAAALATVGLVAAACSSSGGSSNTGANQSPAGAAHGTVSIKLTSGHLTNSDGRTVYLWMADKNGKSACSGTCASFWPPVPGSAKAGSGLSAAKVTTVTRSGGGTQLVYAGHPLYYFANDKSAGQTSGQGLDNFGAKWWEVSPAGAPLTAAAPASSAPMSSAPSSKSGGGGYTY